MRKSLLFLGAVLLSTALLFSCDDDSANATTSKKKKKKKRSDDEFTLGLKFESKDKLDGIPFALTPFGGDELPEAVDLSTDMPEIGNQGDQQSCVAWSLAYALKSYQEKKETGKSLQFSPSYIYNQINGGENVPTYVTDGLELLTKQGVCLLEDMPYDANEWTAKPSKEAQRHARNFRIDYWKQVDVSDVREVKAQLAAGYPIVIGANVSQEFISEGAQEKENYIWREKGTPAGGHAMVVVGYDDSKKAFKLMNSWGKEWGDNGFGWITYKLFPEVVKYGFIAKDGYTDQGAIENKEQTFDETDFKNQDLNPRDNPTSFDTISFHQSNVSHNVTIPNDTKNGAAMKIEGTLDIPPGLGKKFQIVVHIYDAATNKQVKSLIYPDYSDINNFAAGYTPEYTIDPNGFRKGTWWLHIPYSAIDLPNAGTNNLYAIPTLFVDNFGVAYGERVDFWVKK